MSEKVGNISSFSSESTMVPANLSWLSVELSSLKTTTHSPLLNWLTECRLTSGLKVQSTAWTDLQDWQHGGPFLEHRTGKFFKVASLPWFSGSNTDAPIQPIILQPEIGILGFVVAQQNSQPHILIQAKTEPGNVGGTQLAPSVQATVSNYTRVHGGTPTPFLDLFLDQTTGSVVSDSLQSEQGTRFLGKYNRNMTVVINSILEVEDNRYRWFLVKDLLSLLSVDFCINTDARSVLVASDWSVLAGQPPFIRHFSKGGFGEHLYHSMVSEDNHCLSSTISIVKRLKQLQSPYTKLALSPLALSLAEGWEKRQDGLYDKLGKNYDVKLFTIATGDREVSQWQQPLIMSCQEQEIILLTQQKYGILHFLLKVSREPGFKEGVQLGPSVQSEIYPKDPLLLFCHQANSRTLIRVRQSDEGGRFLNSIATYSLLEVMPDEPVPRSSEDFWVSLGQIYRLLKIPGALTNEARSALSLVLLWL
ncbi:MAG: NDP-hexose 2,3-dehydratase family protein [Nodosilinea sp.]